MKFTILRSPRSHASISLAHFSDKNLRWTEKGVLSYLLAKDAGCSVSQKEIIESGPDGRDAVRAIFKNLRNAGYLQTFRVPFDKGKFKWFYRVFDLPQDPETTREIIPLKMSDLPGLLEALSMSHLTIGGKPVYGQEDSDSTIDGKPVHGETLSEQQTDHRRVAHTCSTRLYRSKSRSINLSKSLKNTEVDESCQPPERENFKKDFSQDPASVSDDRKAAFDAACKREKERIENSDPNWDGVPEHIQPEHTPGYSELAPEVRDMINSQWFGKTPPGSETPPDELGAEGQIQRQKNLQAQRDEQIRRLKEYEETGKYPAPKPAPAQDPAPQVEQTPQEPESTKGRSAIFTSGEGIKGRLNAKMEQIKSVTAANFNRLAEIESLFVDGLAKGAKLRVEGYRAAAQEEKGEAEIYLAMPVPEMVTTLYAECVENKTPEKDERNVNQFILWLSQQSEDAKKAAIKAFRQAKGKVHSLAPVKMNLQRLGFMPA